MSARCVKCGKRIKLFEFGTSNGFIFPEGELSGAILEGKPYCFDCLEKIYRKRRV